MAVPQAELGACERRPRAVLRKQQGLRPTRTVEDREQPLMKAVLSGIALIATCAPINAQECPDIAPYAKGRQIIEDLQRIVAPTGIQESYKTRIGGIEQWLNVRGQDKANPFVLSV